MNLSHLEENHTYLIKKSFNTELHSITILCITKEAYQMRWNNYSNIYVDWESIKDFDGDYRLVEDITEIFHQKFEEKNVDNDWFARAWKWVDTPAKSKSHPHFLIQETCPTCNGCGTTKSLNPSQTTSIGLVTCPTCNGGKTVSKRIDIIFD